MFGIANKKTEIEEKKKQKEQKINQIIEKNKDKLVSAIRRIESLTAILMLEN